MKRQAPGPEMWLNNNLNDNGQYPNNININTTNVTNF